MESSQYRQMLAPEEQVLLDWFRQRAQERRLWTPQELRARAHNFWQKMAHEVREILRARPAKL